MQDDDVTAAFPNDTRRAFAFVERHGFSCVLASSSRVRYESSCVFVEIRHSDHDGEVEISFGRLPNGEEHSFTLFLRLVNPKLEIALGERLVENRQQLIACLDKLSGALQLEGQPILAGDEQVFERMRQVRWWHFQPDAVKSEPQS